MTIKLEQIAKYSVYSLGLVATIATSPMYNFYGTMGFNTGNIAIDEATEFIPFSASSLTNNPDNVEIDSCYWEPLFELNGTLSEDTEMVIWKLETPWDQAAFDEAYAIALAEAETVEGEPEDTSTPEDTATGDTSETVADSGWDAATDDALGFNPEHQVFYDTLSAFGLEESYRNAKYRVMSDGSLVSMDSFYDEGLGFGASCADSENHFLITIKGEPVDLSVDLSMMRHEGTRIASKTLSCGRDRGPDYSDVNISVELDLSRE